MRKNKSQNEQQLSAFTSSFTFIFVLAFYYFFQKYFPHILKDEEIETYMCLIAEVKCHRDWLHVYYS